MFELDIFSRLKNWFFSEKNASEEIADQGLILKQLIVYVTLTEKNETVKQETIQKLSKGQCHGFVLSHFAQEEKSKLERWETALKEVVMWDKKRESLEEYCSLPGETKQKKRSEIFDNILKSVIKNQASDHQQSFINPHENSGTPKFQLSKKSNVNTERKKEFMTLKKYASLAGYFSEDEIKQYFLNEKNIENNLALITIVGAHVIRLKYESGIWKIYDPNYNHMQKTERTFKTKDACAKEIMRILSNISDYGEIKFLRLQVASFREDTDIIINQPPLTAERLAYGGLHGIATYTPDALPKLLRLAESNSTIRAAIATSLSLIDKDNWSGLHVIATYTPDALPKLLRLAESNSDIRAAIAKSLSLIDKGNWSGLHVIAGCAPDALPQLLSLAESNSNIRAAIATSLLSLIDKEDWSGLHMIAMHAPDALPQLLSLAESNSNIRAAIATSLSFIDKDNWSGLHMIAMHAPNALPQLLSLAESNSNIRAIGRYIPDALPQLLRLTKSNLDIQAAIAKSLSLSGKNNWSGLHMIARYAPDALPKLLRLAESNPDIQAAIATSLSFTSKNNWSGLRMVAKYAPDALSQLFTLSSLDKEAIANILNEMKKVIKLDNKTAIVFSEALTTAIKNDTAKPEIKEMLVAALEDISTVREVTEKMREFGLFKKIVKQELEALNSKDKNLDCYSSQSVTMTMD